MMTRLTLMLVLSTSSLASAQTPFHERMPARQAGPDMVIKWNEVALQAIRADRTSPPIASRNLAILHIAVYDAVMAIEQTHRPYLTEVLPRPGTSAEAAAAVAAHKTLVAAYPQQRAFLDAVLARCWRELPVNANSAPAVALGLLVAERILEARRDDGSQQAAGRYAFVSAPGRWQPTAPDFQDALLPGWAYLKPFALRQRMLRRPPGPPPLTSQAYTDAFNEVQRLGQKVSPFRTPDQTQIAHFWADDLGTVTPPGHWNKIAQTIAQNRGHTLAQNARLFAHLNLSLAEAGTVCWVIKFMFDFWRPITAILQADRDGNPDTAKDAAWTPLLNTPPFPAYVSGHSTFSAAAAASLAVSLGTDEVWFTTTSDALPGVNRSFRSLWSAAEEAGMSRIYGGIHWQFDNTDGLILGREVGEHVTRNTLQARR